MFPPRPVLDDARARHQIVIGGLRPGTITIGGVEIDGAVAIGGETFALGPRGTTRVQSFEALLEKCKVGATPSQGDLVMLAGLGYKIDEVYGHEASEISWHLRGSRTPGKDT